ncbi:hypothetical protein DIPPA_12847 [Diplonema papillatum]|nr:hypothetical protein DIPPA_12847 [Diplonema papillatum]
MASPGVEYLSRREVARRKMVAFYARYLPDKVPGVDAILDQYRGREDALIKAMKIKYPTWNFDDLSSVVGSPGPYAGLGGGGRGAPYESQINVQLPQSGSINIVPSQHGGGITMSPRRDIQMMSGNPPNTYLSRTGSPGVGPIAGHFVQVNNTPTRDELHDVVSQLQQKLLHQQKSEMSSLQQKLEKLMILTQASDMRPPSHQGRHVSVQRPEETEMHKQQALFQLRQQVEGLSRAVQSQGPDQAASRALPLQQILGDLEEMKSREGQRLRESAAAQGELAKIRRENQLLKEEGEEGRELIMELHGVVEQLRHANQTKTSEIEGLIRSAQVLKQHYEAAQSQLQYQQPPRYASPPSPLPRTFTPPAGDAGTMARSMAEQLRALQESLDAMRQQQQPFSPPPQQYGHRAPSHLPDPYLHAPPPYQGSGGVTNRGGISPPRRTNYGQPPPPSFQDSPSPNPHATPLYNTSDGLLETLRLRTQQNLASR